MIWIDLIGISLESSSCHKCGKRLPIYSLLEQVSQAGLSSI